MTHQDFTRLILEPHRGRVVVVSFWASYCAPCIDELPGLLKLRARVAPRGAEIVFVSVDDPSQVAALHALARKRGFPTFETFLVTDADPQPFIDAVDPGWAGEVPYAVVYGRDGALRARLSGEQPLQAFERAIEEALWQP